jgi:hypothetical protein
MLPQDRNDDSDDVSLFDVQEETTGSPKKISKQTCRDTIFHLSFPGSAAVVCLLCESLSSSFLAEGGHSLLSFDFGAVKMVTVN